MKKKKIILISLASILFIILVIISFFAYMISPVGKEEISNEFIVETGQTYTTIGKSLKANKLIRNETFYKIYIKLLNPSNLESGVYYLSPSMNLTEIVDTLESGASNIHNTISLTFVEGKNMRYFIDKVTKNFNITEDNILETLSDTSYLDTLIEKYWFLTDEIKNKNIYYSLEGYLYPDTYDFYEDASLKDIIEKMLNNMGGKIESYKSEIESSDYTFHQMLTLSSIIEQEASNSNDRKGVAGVFYNRLKSNWSLGSDVTTYYAEKLELWSRDLYISEINDCNSYNTRASCMSGKLPVGPICNPSIKSLEATIEPEINNYYYFVADINGETYFNKTASGHSQTVSKLKSEGKWYQY